MMQQSKERIPTTKRSNSRLFDQADGMLSSGKKDEDDITKHTPLDSILNSKTKVNYQDAAQGEHTFFRMNTGKSNATDMTTDMFMNMLKSGEAPQTNFQGATGQGTYPERRSLMRG